MTEEIEISINLGTIPPHVGVISGGPLSTSSTIYSKKQLKMWIFDQIPNTKHLNGVSTKITVFGPMSNCIALHVGKWLGEKQIKMIYQSFSGFKMEVV